MAVTYWSILADVGNALGALKSLNVAGAETSYTDAQAGTISSNWISPDYSLTRTKEAVYDGVQDVIFDLATSGHPDLAGFVLDSSSVTSGALLPSTSSGSVKFIGGIISVRDAMDNKLCTAAQLSQVKSIAENASVYGTGIYQWALDGSGVLYHTRTNVIVRRVGYTRPSSFTGNIALPDQYKPIIVSAALLHLLTKEGAASDLWAQCTQIYQAFSQSLRNQTAPQSFPSK